jgi:hypothetical protein
VSETHSTGSTTQEGEDQVRAPERRLRAVPAGPAPAASAAPAQSTGVVAFNKDELREILNLYGRKVAEGEWRDYAIDFNSSRAVFSIFRRTSEMPLYRIEKDPKLARRQGAYSVVTATGLILKRGHELARVISVLDKRVRLVVG